MELEKFYNNDFWSVMLTRKSSSGAEHVYDSSTFKYIPLIKTSVIFKKRTGWIRRTFDNKEENLYLDPKEYRIFFKDGRNFKFLSVVDDDPDSIFDLDDIGEFKSIERSKIDYNFSQLKKFDFSIHINFVLG